MSTTIKFADLQIGQKFIIAGKPERGTFIKTGNHGSYEGYGTYKFNDNGSSGPVYMLEFDREVQVYTPPTT